MSELLPVVSFAISLVVLLVLRYTKFANLALDRPNQRSLHVVPIPRTGGIAIMISVLVAWIFIGIPSVWVWIPVLLFGLNVLDDIYNLPVTIRLALQVVVSSIFIAQISEISWLEFSFLALALIWMINLYNFMDGSDGLAGGMTLFGFGAYAFSAYVGDHTQIASMSVVVASASLAFLLFNFHPARIFMGDSGSIPLGFLAGAIGIYGCKEGLWPAWFPLLVFSPFIMDASATLIKRFLKKEKFWQAHKDHYYQRLIRMGWTHRETAIGEYLLMLAVGSSAIALIGQSSWVIYPSLTAWLLTYVILMCVIDKKWRVNCKKS